MCVRKSCLLPQAILVSEAQRMVADAAQCGGTVKAQNRSAASNLGIGFDLVMRARQGRIGARA
jgi:hypothetical protein